MGILSQNNSSSKTDLEWAGVLGSVGISPLLLASFGIVSKMYYSPFAGCWIGRAEHYCRNRNSIPRSNIRVLTAEVLHLPNILALVLAIVGGTRLVSDSASKRSSGHKFSQAGIIIFLVVFIVYVGLCLLTTAAIHSVADGDKNMLYAVNLALPFIFVRILYSMLAVFLTNQTTFALVNGSAIAQLCMATIEEMIVVVVYLGVGITAPVRKGNDLEKSTYAGQRTAA